MKLTFLGATRTVTGSRYLIETDGKRLLIDCGLFQGYKELRLRNWDHFQVDPARLDAVILTHAHIDHSGYLPLLVKKGFRGKIYCTPPTLDLCKLLLPDSGYLNEEDARRANRYHYSKHNPALPLYTLADAEESLNYFHPVPFGKQVHLGDDVRFRFERNGHILGASWVMLTAEKRRVLFSGDIGRPDDPVMRPPVPPCETDYLIVESTYGNRPHAKTDPHEELAAVVLRTVARGGSVIIPAFAVGRAQSLMVMLHQLKTAKRIPNIPIYLDSPMAIGASSILEKYLAEHHLSRELCHEVSRDITYVHTPDASRELDQSAYPKIIIAASGMATGGRILHHLKHLGPDRKNTILLTGFQAAETRGDRLRRGERQLKIHGEIVPIRAEVAQLHNMSAHADYEEILSWLSHLKKAPITTFITHGEVDAAEAMKAHLTERFHWPCAIPDYLQTYEL